FVNEKRVSVLMDLVRLLPNDDFFGLARRSGWANKMVAHLWRHMDELPLSEVTVDDVEAASPAEQVRLAVLLPSCPPEVALSALDAFDHFEATTEKRFIPSVEQLVSYAVLMDDPAVQKLLV